MTFPSLSSLVSSADTQINTGVAYSRKLDKIRSELLDAVELVTRLVKTKPHLLEHKKFLVETATKLLILQSEAKDRMD